jgi:ornithine--oxo-acid transaminase
MTKQFLMFTPTNDAPKEMAMTRTLQAKQWANLRNALISVGVDVIVPSVPVQSSICADAGIIIGDTFISSSECNFLEWAEPKFRSFAIIGKEHAAFSGRDVIIDGDNLFLGFGYETLLDGKFALDKILESTDLLVRPLELADPVFSTLDTCLCILSDGHALYFPAAFSNHSKYVLEQMFDDKLIAISREDALGLVCNSICVGQSIIGSKFSKALSRKLKELGYNILTLDVSEFLKFGASCKALTISLD